MRPQFCELRCWRPEILTWSGCIGSTRRACVTTDRHAALSAAKGGCEGGQRSGCGSCKNRRDNVSVVGGAFNLFTNKQDALTSESPVRHCNRQLAWLWRRQHAPAAVFCPEEAAAAAEPGAGDGGGPVNLETAVSHRQISRLATSQGRLSGCVWPCALHFELATTGSTTAPHAFGSTSQQLTRRSARRHGSRAAARSPSPAARGAGRAAARRARSAVAASRPCGAAAPSSCSRRRRRACCVWHAALRCWSSDAAPSTRPKSQMPALTLSPEPRHLQEGIVRNAAMSDQASSQRPSPDTMAGSHAVNTPGHSC